ncbi:hypothetical protein ACLOJK_023603 [Asimina triloba]
MAPLPWRRQLSVASQLQAKQLFSPGVGEDEEHANENPQTIKEVGGTSARLSWTETRVTIAKQANTTKAAAPQHPDRPSSSPPLEIGRVLSRRWAPAGNDLRNGRLGWCADVEMHAELAVPTEISHKTFSLYCFEYEFFAFCARDFDDALLCFLENAGERIASFETVKPFLCGWTHENFISTGV